MADERTWNQRSLDDAAQRKSDREEGRRTGIAFNNASNEGAFERHVEQRAQKAFDDYVEIASKPVVGETLPSPGQNNKPLRLRLQTTSRARREPTGGEKIQAWLNHLPSRVPSAWRWTGGTIVALAGFGASLLLGVAPVTAVIYGLALVAGLVMAGYLTLFTLGLVVVLAEMALYLALTVAALCLFYIIARAVGIF